MSGVGANAGRACARRPDGRVAVTARTLLGRWSGLPDRDGCRERSVAFGCSDVHPVDAGGDAPMVAGLVEVAQRMGRRSRVDIDPDVGRPARPEGDLGVADQPLGWLPGAG